MLRLVRAFALAPLVAAAASAANAQGQAPSPSPDTTVAPVTVTGERPQVQSSIDRRTYSLAKDLTAQTGSVADVLRNIPSVSVDVQGNPTLQGQGNVTVLIDGRPSTQFSGSNLGAALQSMPADQVDRIEVMTNPPAEFRAEGSGGIINLVTKRAKGAGASGSFRVQAGSYRRAWATVNLGYNAGPISLTAMAGYRHVPQRWVEIQDLSRDDVATGRDISLQHWTRDKWFAHGGADYDLDGRTRLSAQAGWSTNLYDAFYADRFTSQAAALARDGHEHSFYNSADASLTWKRTYGEGHDLTLDATFSGALNHDGRTDLLDTVAPAGQPGSRARIAWTDMAARWRASADYRTMLAGGGKLKFGYDFEYAPARIRQNAGAGGLVGDIGFDPARHDVFLDTETDNEAYVSYERKLGKLSWLAGLRAEDARFALSTQTAGGKLDHDYARLFPNLHLAYELGEGSQLTASFSRRTNRPNDEQLNPFVLSQTPTSLYTGKPDLKPDDYFNYQLGYEAKAGERAWSLTGYYHERFDAFRQVTTILPGGVYQQQAVNAGQVRSLGGEWALSDKLTAKLRYNLSFDVYWHQLSAPALGAPTRTTVTGFGHANLSWQATRKDLVQLDLTSNARSLQPQGAVAPYGTVDFGYRHTLGRQVAWMLLVNDPFHSIRYRTVETIGDVQSRRLAWQGSRMVSLALVWTFAGKAKEPDFDFGPGGGK